LKSANCQGTAQQKLRPLNGAFYFKNINIINFILNIKQII
jgi:hypothetical protein